MSTMESVASAVAGGGCEAAEAAAGCEGGAGGEAAEAAAGGDGPFGSSGGEVGDCTSGYSCTESSGVYSGLSSSSPPGSQPMPKKLSIASAGYAEQGACSS